MKENGLKHLEKLGLIKIFGKGNPKKQTLAFIEESVGEWLDTRKINGKRTTSTQNDMIETFIFDQLLQIAGHARDFGEGEFIFSGIFLERARKNPDFEEYLYKQLADMAMSNLVNKYDYYFDSVYFNNVAVKSGPVEDDDEDEQ